MNYEWHSGPPPHVGWWNASVDRNEKIWSWWNGANWSVGLHENTPAEHVARRAATPSAMFSDIEWTRRWPEGARVPRLDPTRGHWAFHDGSRRPPVDGHVEVMLRNGLRFSRRAAYFIWDYDMTAEDVNIVAWRPL